MYSIVYIGNAIYRPYTSHDVKGDISTCIRINSQYLYKETSTKNYLIKFKEISLGNNTIVFDKTEFIRYPLEN